MYASVRVLHESSIGEKIKKKGGTGWKKLLRTTFRIKFRYKLLITFYNIDHRLRGGLAKTNFKLKLIKFNRGAVIEW